MNEPSLHWDTDHNEWHYLYVGGVGCPVGVLEKAADAWKVHYDLPGMMEPADRWLAYDEAKVSMEEATRQWIAQALQLGPRAAAPQASAPDAAAGVRDDG